MSAMEQASSCSIQRAVLARLGFDSKGDTPFRFESGLGIPVAQPRVDDGCKYRAFELANGVTAIAIEQPASQLAAGAATVGVGHMQDPVGVPGLAHFLEHMAFLGSERYPVEGEYKTFLKTHGGSCNASTSAEYTTYRFQIPAKHGAAALDRMADALAAPLLRPEPAGREVQAVDSEFRRNLQNDSRWMFQTMRSLSGPGHPWRRFGTGSAASLLGAKGDPDTACDLLRGLWERFYVGSRVTVAVVSPLPLDMTESAIQESFCRLRATHTPAGTAASASDAAVRHADTALQYREPVAWWLGGGNAGGSAFPPRPAAGVSAAASSVTPQWGHPLSLQCGGAVGREIFLQAVRPLRQLVVTFPLLHQSPGRTTRVTTLLSWALGHEGRQSLLWSLKTHGLASALSAGPSVSNGFTSLSLTITLTDHGDTCRDAVLALVFATCARLRAEKPADLLRCWEECRSARSAAFAFRETPSPMNQAVAVAKALQQWPAPLALAGPALLGPLDSEAESLLLAQLQRIGPANCVIVHRSPHIQASGIAAELTPKPPIRPSAGGASSLAEEHQPCLGLTLPHTEQWYTAPFAQRAVSAARLISWGAALEEAAATNAAANAAIAADANPGRSGQADWRSVAGPPAASEASEREGMYAPVRYHVPAVACGQGSPLALLSRFGVELGADEARLPQRNRFLPTSFEGRVLSESAPADASDAASASGRGAVSLVAASHSLTRPEADVATDVFCRMARASTGAEAAALSAPALSLMPPELVRFAASRLPLPLVVGRLGAAATPGVSAWPDRPGATVWHHSGHFGIPRASVTATARFDPVCVRRGEALPAITLRVAAAALQDAVMADMYDSELAGYSHSVHAHPDGLTTVVYGFSEHLDAVVDTLQSGLGACVAEEAAAGAEGGWKAFEAAVGRQKQVLRRHLVSMQASQASEIAARVLHERTTEAALTPEELLGELDGVSSELCRHLLRQGLLTAQWEILVHGDASPSDAVSLADRIVRLTSAPGSGTVVAAADEAAVSSWAHPLADDAAPWHASAGSCSDVWAVSGLGTLPRWKLPVAASRTTCRVLLPAAGEVWRVTEPHTNPADSNSAVRASVFIDPDAVAALPWHGDRMFVAGIPPPPALRATALCAIVGKMIDQPFFHSLRTVQQVGYVVRAGAGGTSAAPALTMYAQSSWAGVDELEARIAAFLRPGVLLEGVIGAVAAGMEPLGASVGKAGSATPDSAAFEALKQGLITSTLRPGERPAAERQRVHRAIDGASGQLFRPAELAAAITATSSRDVVDFAAALVAEGAPARRVLFARVRCSNAASPSHRLGIRQADGSYDESKALPDNAPASVVAAHHGDISTETSHAGVQLGLECAAPASLPPSGVPKWAMVLAGSNPGAVELLTAADCVVKPFSE